MLKLASGTVFASVLATAGVAAAAPPMVCADKAARNCFVDDVFLMSGDESVTRAAMPAPVVACKTSTDCYLNSTADLFKADGLSATVVRALEIIRSQGVTAPGWEEIVVYTADFGPTRQPGPLFFRMKDAAGTPVNRVQNIGLGAVVEPDPMNPYLGIIDGGNLRTVGANPGTGTYSPCGRLPRPTTNPPSGSAEQPAGAICAPGIYNYFDSLAQATAALYGPHLTALDPMGTNPTLLVTKPTIKATLVDSTGALKTGIDPLLSADLWNSFLDTRGSLLGGNTWRNNSNGTYEAVRPPYFQGASPPDDSRQALRFQPLDLYVLGFAPASEVPALKSFAHAIPGDVYLPASQSTFGPTAGPNMGVRIAGVQLRGKSGLPKDIPFQTIVDANGGARIPAADAAPQSIRQLWIVVTKPTLLRTQIAEDARMAAEKVMAGTGQKAFDDSLVAQDKEQDTEIGNIQKHRRAWNQYFYLMTTYRGRAITAVDGTTDDLAYWEFADVADEKPSFVPGGGLELDMRGPEVVPNTGGARQSVLSVTNTPGSAGVISYMPPAGTTLRIQGNQKVTTAPNNVFSVRMRLPADASLTGRVKAKIVLKGPDGNFEATVPSAEGAFLVPDGRFRTYSALLSHTTSVGPDMTDPAKQVVVMTENKDYTGKTYTGFDFIPSNVQTRGIDIEFLRVGNYPSVAETDLDCAGALKPDGFIGPDDNCPLFFNPNQVDTDQDGVGDDCEDFDGDRTINACDNCSTTTNATQSDVNFDGLGDACDPTFEGVGCALRRGSSPSLPRGGLALLAAGALVLVGRRWRRHARGQS